MADTPKKPRPQPGKNKTVRTQRRRVIAKALVAQVPPGQIARGLGISRQMVNLEIRSAETQEFVKSAMAPYLDDIKLLIRPAIRAVRDGLTKKQDMVDRLRAVRVTGYLLELAEGKRNDGSLGDRPRRFAGTMEDLLVLYRQTTLEIQATTGKGAARP